MKIKKINQTNYSFTKLNLLNLKYYLKFSGNNNHKPFINKNINELNLNIKNSLRVIFEYHKLKKNIVFVGFNDIKNLKFSLLFKKFKYNILNKDVWVNGILCNSNSIKYYLNSKRLERFFKKENILFLKKFINIKKKVNLIIVYNINDNLHLIKESKKLKIPVISFCNTNSNMGQDTKISLFGENNYHISKFIYFLISSVFFKVFKSSLKKKNN